MATNTSATSQNHNGTGSQANFSISFPFLLNSEIEVTVGGVLKTLGTHYNIVGSQVQFTSGNIPASGTANVVFNRDTNISTKRVDFEDGSVLTEADLDNNVNQILFAQQEIASDYVKRDGTQTVTGDLVFEGSVDDTNETTLAITNPTADRTITVPDRSGTLITSGDTGTVTSTMIADGTIVNADVNASASIDGTKISPNFGSQNIVTSGTVDGRDVSVDGSKLDGIESGATADQTASEIRTLVESASDSNVFTDADHSKLNAIEAGATADQTAAEIRTLVESASDSNVFTDADHTKLNAIEAGATADQTVSEIKSLIAGSPLDASHLAANSVDTTEIASGAIDSTKLNANTVVTNSEQASANVNDTSFFTTSASDARYFNISSGDTIKDGQSFPDNDTTIATTAAINDRIIDLVDDVGGFVPIANETSFPTTNPDAENGTGTVVSVKVASTDLTPSGTTVTIANGAGSGNTVTITGVPSVISSGFGFLVETTTTTHTYTFHRLVPKATEVTAVAGKAVEIGRLGTADAVADMAILGTTDVVADMNLLGTSDVVADMALLATTDVIADMALLAVADVISDMNDLATSGNITAMSTCSTNIASINNASSNISSVNNFGDKYQVASSDPSTDGGGNALAAGDLYFNTSANELKVYTGSQWQGGVTATGNFASITGNTFTGDNIYNDNVKAKFGTGSDLQIFHDNSNSYIQDSGTGSLQILTNQLIVHKSTGTETMAKFIEDGAVELYYNNSKKFETLSTGVKVTGQFNVGSNLTVEDAANVAFTHNSNASFYHRAVNHELRNRNNDRFLVAGSGASNGVALYHFNGSSSSEKFKVASNVQIPADNVKLQLGASQDLQIFHTGSASSIINNTGLLQITSGSSALYNQSDNIVWITKNNASETMAKFIADGAAELFYDNSKKLETTTTGVSITGNITATGTFSSGSGSNQLNITHSGGGASHMAATGDLILKGTDNVYIGGVNNETHIKCTENGRVELYYDNALRLVTTSTGIQPYGDVRHIDNIKATFGTSQDLQIYHDGSNSIIDNTTGELRIQNDSTVRVMATNFNVVDENNSDTIINAASDGAVQLYFDNSKKLETYSQGIAINGNATFPDGSQAIFGAGSDMEIYHIANNTNVIRGSGKLTIQTDDTTTGIKLSSYSGGETFAQFIKNGPVELYYDNSKKFETLTDGVKVSGDLTINNANKLFLENDSENKTSYIFNSAPSTHANITFYTQETGGTAGNRWTITKSGNFIPAANNTYDIGDTSNRVRNVYTNDLNLSNEGGANDVDGTWGSYTIQEGAEDLFLINKRNGKKYKFALAEVA